MSALLLPGYAESGGYSERKKDRTENKVIQNPGDACAEERQGGEQSKVARFGVHVPLPIRKGQRPGCPLFCARVDGLEPPHTTPRGRTAGHLSGSDRATRRPTEGKPPRGDAGLEPAEREATLREIERHTLRQAVHKFLGTSRVPEVRFGPLH